LLQSSRRGVSCEPDFLDQGTDRASCDRPAPEVAATGAPREGGDCGRCAFSSGLTQAGKGPREQSPFRPAGWAASVQLIGDLVDARLPSRRRPCPVWTLRVQAHVRLIEWCLPFGEPHGFAGCRECCYQVEPATASLRAAEGGTSADPVESGPTIRPRGSCSRLVEPARLFPLRKPPKASRPSGESRNRYGGDRH
jgi:hypothetical protein